MNLLTSFFFLNAGRAGAVAGGGGGVLGLVLGFFVLLLIQPYYNSFIEVSTEFIGLSPFDPIVPLTLMVVALVMFFWPIYEIANAQSQALIVLFFKRVLGFSMMALSIPLFIYALIHWWFYTA